MNKLLISILFSFCLTGHASAFDVGAVNNDDQGLNSKPGAIAVKDVNGGLASSANHSQAGTCSECIKNAVDGTLNGITNYKAIVGGILKGESGGSAQSNEALDGE